MKRFAFSLEKVLKYRKEVLDFKISELNSLNHRLRELEEQIETINRAYDSERRALAEKLAEGLSATDLSVYKVYLNDTIKKIKELFEKKLSLIAVIEQKQEVVVALKSELSGLEHLKERQYQEYLRLEQKELERSMEEFFSKMRFSAG
ncbi:MAG: flagellar export protein FliJ [Bacillota bacterium]|nr:flagellar export protein FliJ [Bacillota bacterium]